MLQQFAQEWFYSFELASIYSQLLRFGNIAGVSSQLQVELHCLIVRQARGSREASPVSLVIVEIRSEMSALLDLSNLGEMRSYIDLPERLGCPASDPEIDETIDI